MFLDSATAVTATEAIAQSSSIFSKSFKSSNEIISLKISSQLLFKLKYLSHQIYHRSAICTIIRLDLSLIRLRRNFDIRNN